MALSDVKAQIADDLERDDLTTQIADAIRQAVYAHENERFWFNESYRTTATLSSSAFTATIPATYLKVDRVRFISSAAEWDLVQRDYDFVMARQDVQAICDPQTWCVYNNTLQFDSAPSADKKIVLDGIIRTSTASADTDTAVWFTDPLVKQLVRNEAKFSLYANVIKDPQQATAARSLADLALKRMRERTTTRKASGYVTPSYF